MNICHLHYIIISILIIIFIYLYYETLHHTINKHKKMNRLINSVEFRLYIACVYFVLLIIFIYETSDINHQNKCHPLFEQYGIDITNSNILLFTILFFIFVKYYDYMLDHDNYQRIDT
jgi:hypothetical protein